MLNQSYFHTMKFNLGDYDLRDLGLGDFSLGDFDLIPKLELVYAQLCFKSNIILYIVYKCY